jgi:hypothetical protein
MDNQVYERQYLVENVDDSEKDCKCSGEHEEPMPELKKLKKKTSKKTVPFWSEDPNVLLNKEYITELFPTDNMSFTQKLNAITRLVIIMSILSFLYSKTTRILGIGALSVLAIFLLYFAYERTKKEGMSLASQDTVSSVTLEDSSDLDVRESSLTPKEFSETFDKSSYKNPLSNVLVTDYGMNVHKKPAPPSFTQKGSNTILENAKKMVVEQNPGQPDIADKLFGDLGNEMMFEQSLQPFYSNASTTVPNDQGAFAQFCYGNMISAKEGNMLALSQNNTGRTIEGSR